MKYLFFKNYLNKIINSEGSTLFRNTFCEIDGTIVDITQDGEISCGVHISNIILLAGLIKEGHATINGTIKDMLQSGWYESSELRPGAVILWEVQQKPSGPHAHLGFYIGNDEAMSNLDGNNGAKYPGCPNRHHYTFNDTRMIEKIFWHDKLN